MSFWDNETKNYRFQAFQGKQFAKNHQKELIKKQLRKNQLANLKRKATTADEIAEMCYREHERIKKPFDPTPQIRG